MKYHQLPLTSHRSRKRVGRGIGSGRGKTSGRGTKGQRARSGVSLRPGFEGGQNPLTQRVPKLRGSGMHARHKRPKPTLLFTDQLNRLPAGKTAVTQAKLVALNLIPKNAGSIKLLKRGELTKSVHLKIHAASASAIAVVESAGGKVELIDNHTTARLSGKKA